MTARTCTATSTGAETRSESLALSGIGPHDDVEGGVRAVGREQRLAHVFVAEQARHAGEHPQVIARVVLRGEHSTVLDRDVAERMAKELPRGRLVEIPRAVHTLHEDNPEAVLAALREFLDV